MKQNLRKTIMRRVYYSYTLRFLEEPLLWLGFLLGGLVALFGRLVHVAAIIHNFSQTTIAYAPTYVWKSFAVALQNGDIMKVLVTILIVITAVIVAQRIVTMLLRMGRARVLS